MWGVHGLISKKPSVEIPVVKPKVLAKGKRVGIAGRWAESFLCRKCQMPLTVYKVKIKGEKAKIKGICPSKHEQELLLPIPQQAEWIDTLAKQMFRCKKCGTELLYPEKLKNEGGYQVYKLRCPSCGSSHRYVKMILYSAVEDARMRLVAPPRSPD